MCHASCNCLPSAQGSVHCEAVQRRSFDGVHVQLGYGSSDVVTAVALAVDNAAAAASSKMADKDTIKLISKEGFEFIIDRKAACISNTIKQMLSSEGEPLPNRAFSDGSNSCSWSASDTTTSS